MSEDTFARLVRLRNNPRPRPAVAGDAPEVVLSLEGDLRSGLTVAADAFELLAYRADGWESVLQAYCGFLTAWRNELESNHTFDLLLDGIEWVVWEWSRTFELPDQFGGDLGDREWMRSISSDDLPLGCLLNTVLESRIDFDGQRLIDRLLDHWLAGIHSSAHAAHVICFVARARFWPTGEPLYRDPRVLERVFHRDLVLPFWEAGRGRIAEAVPAERYQEFAALFP